MPLCKNQKSSLIHKTKSMKEEVPQGIFRKASLTAEAALVFPIILFLMVGILFLFRVLQVGVGTYGALSATAGRLALELTEEEETNGRAILYFQKELTDGDVPAQWIRGKRAGIRWDGTDTSGESVRLQIQYDCRLPVSFPGLRHISISQRVHVKKWTGYGGRTSDESNVDPWVYVAQNGEVYHLKRSCSYLQLSIRTATAADMEVYRPCRLCGTKPVLQSVYVTDQGERWHTSLDCGGLKRTIFMYRMSQVADKRLCSRCAVTGEKVGG